MTDTASSPAPLEPGLELGPYRLVEKIGQGGMGVVWKAVDTALDREVALKFLPEFLAGDRERLARFQREAKVLAALSHPSIAAVHGLHEEGGRRFLAMELVPGEDLSRRLARGPLDMDDVLAVARQLAEGMEAAHESGIVHRDLKPGNIMVTADGRVRILDFGLAKAMEEGPSAADTSLSPTLTAPATRTGMVLGTAVTMSPEQARGRPVDRRADIWAFGCVLYEMLCGERVFSGETVSDILAAVLRADPDWGRLPASVPPAVRRLLERCLEKDPRRRLRDMGEARIALEDAAAGVDPAAPADRPGAGTGPLSASLGPGRTLVLGVGILAAVAVAFLAGVSLRPEVPPPAVVKYSIPLVSIDPSQARTPGLAFSPDGGRLAYIDGTIHVRELDRLESRALPGTDRAHTLEWSPDGMWIAYSSGRRLMKVAAGGGDSIQLADLPREMSYAGGICWLPDRRLIFTTGGSGLMQVSEDGGRPEPWVQPAEGEDDFHNCAALPGGAGILTIPHGRAGEGTISLVTAGSRRLILTEEDQDVQTPAWSPSGHILYRKEPTNAGIWALPFSLREMEATGGPFLVAAGGYTPDVSPRGALAYLTSAVGEATRLILVDQQGAEIEEIGDPEAFVGAPLLSPEGTRLAVSIQAEGSDDVWVYDLRRGSRTRLTFATGNESPQAWTPDGERLVISHGQSEDLTLVRADGTGTPESIGRGWHASFSPDGRRLAFASLGRETSYDLWYRDMREGSEPEPFLRTEALEMWPRIAPDGKFVAYQTNASGRTQVILRPFPEGEGQWQVSDEEGFWPVWSPTGDRIFYLGGGRLWETEIRTEPAVALGTPRALLDASWQAHTYVVDWPAPFDIAARGEEILFFLRKPVVPEGVAPPAVTVVLNWAEEFSSAR